MLSRVAPRTNASFGSLLRRFRIGAGLSQAALAEQADLSSGDVDALERDAAAPPTGAALDALVAALALSGDRRATFEAAANATATAARTAGDAPGATPSGTTGAPPAAAGATQAAAGPLASFVGRDAELAEIAVGLRSSRLVTVFGPGGVGKTRIAQQIAVDERAAYPDGVFVAELAPLSDPELIPVALASSLGIADPGGARPLLETVVSALRTKRALVVLDNCEHLRADVAAAAAALLAGCPNVRILATSREGLGIAGELLYRLPPLAFCDGFEPLLGAGDALRYGAVALFVARAQAARADFVLTDANAEVVSEICRRLDGIALAIELAAARLSVLGVDELARRLDDRFRVLTGGGNALPRQQTLRALIDWSFDLLGPAERTVFTRLAVFRGGWTAAAAADVCGGEGIDVGAALASLVDKSLVVADGDDRFRFTATTGEYAMEKLQRSGEHDAVAARFAGWALRFAERADAAWEKTPELAWRASVECELDNLRAALDWSLGRGRDPLTGAGIAAALSIYWRSAKREGRRWFEAALAALDDDAPPPLCARIALGLSWTLPVGRSSLHAVERAVRAYREIGDRRSLSMALLTLSGSLRDEPGWLERGEAAVSEALAIAQSTCFFRVIPTMLAALAECKRQRGRFEEARALLEQALTMAREEGNLLGLSTALSRLAEVEFDSGEFAAARRYGAEATEIDGRRAVANAVSADRCDLAAYAIADGDLDDACAQARAVIAMNERVDQPVHLTIAIDHLAVVAALRGEVTRAARLIGYTDAMFRRLAYARQPVEQRGEAQARAILAERLTEDDAMLLAADGESLSRDEAVTEALAAAGAAQI